MPIGSLALALAVGGLIVNRLVDFLRNAFDKHDAVPKAYWIAIAHGIGIGVAYFMCKFDPVALALHLPKNPSCVAIVITGLGLGSIAGFWHEVMSALSARTTTPTPKGLVPTVPPTEAPPAH